MQDRPIKIELHRGYDRRSQQHVGNHYGWRWTARSGGRIIAASTEAYTERVKAVDNIALVFGIPLRRLVKPGARTINITYRRVTLDTFAGHTIEVKTR